MEDLEQRLDYLEETNDMLLMQNRVLAAALQGFLRAMPPEMAENIVDPFRLLLKTKWRSWVTATAFTPICSKKRWMRFSAISGS